MPGSFVWHDVVVVKKKSPEERRAAYDKAMAEMDVIQAQSRADRAGDGEGVARYAARTAAEQLLLMGLFVAIVAVPALVGLVAAGSSGLLLGAGIGAVLAVIVWVVFLVIGVRGIGRAFSSKGKARR